jgi:hypothetical protein
LGVGPLNEQIVVCRSKHSPVERAHQPMSVARLKIVEGPTNYVKHLRLTAAGFNSHLCNSHDIAVFDFAIEKSLRKNIAELIGIGRSLTSGISGLFRRPSSEEKGSLVGSERLQ